MFHSIGQLVTSKAVKSGFARSIEAAVVVAKATTVGAGRWQATRFRHNCLTLVAPGAIAAHELVLRRPGIITEINAAFGEPIVNKLIIRSQ